MPDPAELRERLDLEALPSRIPYPRWYTQLPQRVALGKRLFFDPILSGERDVARATGHRPDPSCADGRQLPAGAGGGHHHPFGHGLDAFRREPITPGSPSDRFIEGDDAALSPAEQGGLEALLRRGHTGREADKNAFRTPGQRDVDGTAQHMHHGALPTLREAVDFHDRGGNDLGLAASRMDPRKLELGPSGWRAAWRPSSARRPKASGGRRWDRSAG